MTSLRAPTGVNHRKIEQDGYFVPGSEAPSQMRTFHRFISLVTVLLAVGWLPVQAQTMQDSQEMLEGLRNKHELPALAMVVVKDGVICDRAAVGARKQGEATPVTTKDVWHIGSCTKSMTATLAAMLVEAGRLRWDTTIVEVFPQWKGRMNKAYAGVTVEQLLTHRGGAPADPPRAAWKRAWQQKGSAVEQRKEFILAILEEAPQAAPGSRMIYSNQGYAIVGAMLEKLEGKPWEELIAEKLFKPLKMDSAGFGAPGTKGKVDQPWGHTGSSRKAKAIQTDNPPAIAPGGRVHCTLDDLARFVMFHLEPAKAGLLTPETVRRLHTAPEGSDYACGWVVAERGWAGGKALTHSGSNTMWYLVMWLAPEKNFAVIAATNITGPESNRACDEVASAMIGKWLTQ